MTRKFRIKRNSTQWSPEKRDLILLSTDQKTMGSLDFLIEDQKTTIPIDDLEELIMVQNIVEYPLDGRNAFDFNLPDLAIKMKAICPHVTGVGTTGKKLVVHFMVNHCEDCRCSHQHYHEHTTDCWQCKCGKSTEWHKTQMLPVIRKFIIGG